MIVYDLAMTCVPNDQHFRTLGYIIAALSQPLERVSASVKESRGPDE